MPHSAPAPTARGTRLRHAVTPTGVHVIDLRHFDGRRPALSVDGSVVRQRNDRLVVGAADSTSLVEGVLERVAAVRDALFEAGLCDVPVRGAVCLVDAAWPTHRGLLTVAGVDVLAPERLSERLAAAGPLDAAQVAEVERVLASALPVS